jgi:xanthine dehydrogenase accessory factor
MREVFREAVKELGKGEAVVVATVVRTKGSTPQKPGAKLLVRSDGSGVGTLGGGCVEGDIWFAARELMKRGGDAEHRDYELNEDLAAEEGLICGGTMYFLIDPVYEAGDYMPYAESIDKAYGGGPAAALVSLIKPAEGNTTPTGAKLFVREDGSTDGSLGSSKLDGDAVKKALELMALGNNEYVTTRDGAEYFVEAFTTPPQLVLVGGGHVSNAIAPLAETLGFRVFVTDDREEFANADRFPNAAGLLVASPEDAIPQLPINANTYIVVATRGHRYDNVALETAARTPARYVGLMGSKRKAILIFEDLIRSGLPMERIRQIRSPIGLDLRARTPDEIALSIMSEVLMFRLGGAGEPMKLEDWRLDRIRDKVLSEEPAGVAD